MPPGQISQENHAAEGTAAQGRLRGPERSLGPHVPTPTKGLGRGGASSPGQGKEDFNDKPYCKVAP